MIKRLSEEVQGKLRSGVAVSSLQQCVEELILNSIDAGASCVGVRMDMEAFKVQVIDNGSGMSVGDMERVGNRYYTSKCSSVEDLENLRSYGFRGEAVASIVCLATLVEISSRAKSSVKTHVKVFKEGSGSDVFEAETTRPCAGTTFVICNFFHNMPVRRKRMDAVLEGERIRHRVEAISLMHPSVSFTLKNDCTGTMMVKLPKARDTYHRFVQIHGVGRAQKLREVSHASGQFAVIGHIGREGHYNNSLQFLYVNERLLLKTRIHKLLNLLLRKLKNDSPDLQSAAATTRSPKHKRGGQELHGTYIVNIKCSYSEYDICLEPAKTLIEFKDWDGVLLCVEEAVNVFLSRENLVVELSREDDLEETSPKLFGKAGADQEGVRASLGISTLECCIGRTLASEAVHRKREEGDGVLENGVGIDQTSDQMECNEEGEEERHTNDQKHKCTKSEECRGGAPRCELVALTPTDGLEPLDEEEPTFSGAEEDSQGVDGSTPISVCRQESEQLKRACSIISIAEELQPDSLNCIKRTALKSISGHGQTLAGNGRISLSDEPYVHESLQTWDLSQINTRLLENASKRKISLIQRSGRVRPGQKATTDCIAVIPAKIPKFTSCKKLSLRQEAGSLDQFRRIYGKSDELTSPSLDRTRCVLTDAREPQTDSFNLTPQGVPVRQEEEERERGIAETRNMQRDFQSPPTVSMFTKIKPPVSVQSRTRGISLAAKLSRHLKQRSSEVTQTVLTPRPSLDDTCLRSADDGNREDDDNNDEHPHDTALNPEPVPSCDTTSPPLVETEEATTAAASDCWLRHYDTSAGKTVYVNKVTGLSRYEDPPLEETQVRCTSDVTNMAVSVVSKTGFEYRCYPFQIDLVLPFLPKSKAERVMSSGLPPDDNGGEGVETSNSLSSLYSKWSNPVFVRPPTVGVDVSSGHADGLAVKIHNILFPYRFSKAMIHSMKVIHQVDKKFLACLINTGDQEPETNSEAEGNLLVLVDQHAAHERVRLENLVADSYEDDPDAPGERRLCSSTILPPLKISVTEEELRLLGSCQQHLRSLGLEVEMSQAGDPQVRVRKVPLCFVEKESNETKRGRPSVIKPVVEEYLREQIELLRSTGRVRGTLPLTVQKVLASLACHGAIKFNDSLSRDECCSLVASLSSCRLPFQCAHGRPSIAPLVDVLHLDKDQEELQKPNLQKLRRMYKAWKLFGNR